jgi:hypothetical protein|tara:strand:- start:168 stop:593 length:426 start_codon:yes stop_codon:yes gene_type:complete
MSQITIQDVPIRGEIDRVREDGHVIASTQIEPVEILAIATENGVINYTSKLLTGSHSNWNYEAGTVDVTLECADSVYLAALESAIAAVPDLRAAELAIMVKSEIGMSSSDKAESEAKRVAFGKGVQISSDDLATWKQANGS